MVYSKSKSTQMFVEEQIQNVIEELDGNCNLNSVLLFGSCARGTAVRSSDIDIAVIHEGDITLPSICSVDWHVYPPSALRTQKLPIHAIIVKEGIPLSHLRE